MGLLHIVAGDLVQQRERFAQMIGTAGQAQAGARPALLHHGQDLGAQEVAVERGVVVGRVLDP